MAMRPREMRELFKKATGQGISIRYRLALYWVCMALAALSAALLLLSVTGVISRASRQFGEALELQQKNTTAILTAQIDMLTAKSVSFSEQISSELNGFLAKNGVCFEQLNDDPELIAELESALLPTLHLMLESNACSGAYLCLDATANTSLPDAAHSRMGLYLRYSSLRSATPKGNVVFFRGAVSAARKNGIPLHNRWNPELNTALIPGYEQVMASDGSRISEDCLWTERLPLPDTWEDVTLLCVPVFDEAGVVRGVCGVELSDLYFTLAHSAISSPYGSFVTVLSPLDGDMLLLDKAMLGNTEGTLLSASGVMNVRSGKHYDTFTCNSGVYLGKYQTVPGRLADGLPLTAVTLVPEGSFRAYERAARTGWVAGSFVFLAGMLALSFLLSNRFAKPITKSLAAVRDSAGTPEMQPTGISEIDELVTILQSRQPSSLPQDSLPPEVGELISTFAARAETLTGTERTLLRYYIDGYATRDIPDLMFISAGTVKAHNRNIYRKLDVTSYDELKAYINVFRRCGQIDRLLDSHTEDR